MKRVGIYGGSFAPPHKGHLKSALSFYDECALDELYILPAGEPPHKTLQGNAGPEERFFMTELTFSKENCGARRIFVSDYELKKAGKSYSFETAEHFAAPGTELFLAVGSDMFLSFESWKHPEILLRLCTLVLNRREKDLPEQTFEEQKRRLEDLYGARILLSDFVPFRVSSTEIRELLKNGEDPSALLCPAVYDYIKSRNLFFFQEGQLAKIEEYLRNALSAKRFAHVQSVRRELEKMLSFFDLPAGEAFILQKAALLHDLTHEKTLEEQKELAKDLRLSLSKEDLLSPAILHQYTGAALAEKLFSLEPSGVSAIACHTTGKENMTIGEMLLCLADYIEETRPYPSCRKLHDLFYKGIEENPVEHLEFCMLLYLREVVENLRKKGNRIHPLTLSALNFYEKKLGSL